MTKMTVENLHDQLKHYEIQVQNYEHLFLENDGAIAPEEQATIDSIKLLINTVRKKLPIGRNNTFTTPSAAFNKKITALTTAAKKLQATVEQLQKAGKLAAVQDKVDRKIQTLEQHLPQLEQELVGCKEAVALAGQAQLEEVVQLIELLKKQGSSNASATTEESATPTKQQPSFESVGAMLQHHEQLLASFQNSSYLKALFAS